MTKLRLPALLLTAVGAGALVAALLVGSGLGATQYAMTPTSAGAIDVNAIPLGDGYVSSTPKVGYVDSCQTSFSASAGGAQNVGPWIDTSNKTWNESTKIAVSGSVSWPSANYSVKSSGDDRVITFNDLPTDHTTGTFPVISSDPAAAYDKNPNHIAAQGYTWSLPADPTAANTPSCVGMGAIGVLDDGVILYNALDGEGRDAGAHEVLDACGGHPDQSDTYHHHDVPACIADKVANGTSQLVGYALDGYGIYVTKDADGNMPTNTDLDACHGTTSPVPWDGETVTMYHYVATLEYPYTVGCYHGTPIDPGHGSSSGSGSGGQSGSQRGAKSQSQSAQRGQKGQQGKKGSGSQKGSQGQGSQCSQSQGQGGQAQSRQNGTMKRTDNQPQGKSGGSSGKGQQGRSSSCKQTPQGKQGGQDKSGQQGQSGQKGQGQGGQGQQQGGQGGQQGQAGQKSQGQQGGQGSQGSQGQQGGQGGQGQQGGQGGQGQQGQGQQGGQGPPPGGGPPQNNA